MTSKKEFQTGKTKGIRIANLDDLGVCEEISVKTDLL